MDIADPEAGLEAKPDPVASERYRTRSTLGAGGMGIVYLAEDRKLHRQVAIKKLKDDAASQNARDRIQQEGRLLAQLNHPNIVALYDVLEEGDSIALVMEYIEGTTLRAWMRERRPSLQQKLSLLMQICKGLTEAHNLGIIHRDLKSDNILIAENSKGEPVAKITDFGIAKSQQLDEKTLTAENQLAGTITAMSPEQIQGKTLDARSDLFSLGTIAFELLCGSRPFEKHEGGALAMASRITSEPHIPPQQAWPGIPEPLAVLLDKLLAKDPAQRPQSALIVYQGFELLYKQGLESDTEDFTATLTDLFTHQKVKSRRRWQRALAGVAAALVLSAGGYWGWKEITRLEPQYIAVMPVEINGEIRGEENAKALTKTMVRQALMNSVSQLKASALVSFEPKEGMDFEAQLQALRDKGVTDALFAQLECAEVRCEIGIQIINPGSQFFEKLENITVLPYKKVLTSRAISDHLLSYFPAPYIDKKYKQKMMGEDDYKLFLQVATKVFNSNFDENDLTLLERLSEIYPNFFSIYDYYLTITSQLYFLTSKTEHLNNGLKMLSRAKHENFSDHQLLELTLKANIYTKHSADLEQKIEKTLNKGNPPASLFFKYSEYLYTKKQYSKSLQYAEKAFSLSPSSEYKRQIALCLYNLGMYRESEIKLQEIIDKNPESWLALETLGAIYLETGDYTALIETYQKIPDTLKNWHTLSNLGTAFFIKEEYNKAENYYLMALEKSPGNIGVLANLAETLMIQGKNKSAKDIYQKIIDLSEFENDDESRMYRALSLSHHDQHNTAISEIVKLLQKNPNDTYTRYYAAQIYSLAREFRSAAYHIAELKRQGMGAELLRIPAIKNACSQLDQKTGQPYC